MTVLRIHKKENNFLILDKECLNNSKLSWAAKGLHAYLMGMASGWKVQVKHLQNQASNGRDAVRNYLSELEESGYIVKEWIRDAVTGKFTNLEYVVHETSQKETEELSTTMGYGPHPENPSTVNCGAKTPAPGNPSPANPSPANPTLININNNKYQDKKILKTAADNKRSPLETKNAAAVFSIPQSKGFQNLKPLGTPGDSLIGETLTDFQLQRIQLTVDSLVSENKENLTEEIQYSLLDTKQFSGCGNDFARKLNAIKKVIAQGLWQTPAGMVSREANQPKAEHATIQVALNEAYAEIKHFKNLSLSANEATKKTYAEIVEKVQIKIKHLAQQLVDSAQRMKQQNQ
jgi:hypothetical protein